MNFLFIYRQKFHDNKINLKQYLKLHYYLINFTCIKYLTIFQRWLVSTIFRSLVSREYRKINGSKGRL